jgi:predicted AlkP superfamily pyrophosphatase or phosphodiesterase
MKGSGGINAPHQRDKPYLVLVSIDGFGWDYVDRFPTPNIRRLASIGSRAERLVPVYPTLTFPNHYSIATGLYPARHGLVANSFPDPARDKWFSMRNRDAVRDGGFYFGEPIWVTAENQGMVAASFFFVGSEAPIMGVSPTHWRSYDGSIPGEQRVDQVLAWLAQPEETRPHLYTLYFSTVDNHSHRSGPDSPENFAAIGKVDGYIGRLLMGLKQLPHGELVNIILLSDHGLSAYRKDPRPFILADHVDLADTTIVEGGSYLSLYLDNHDSSRASTIVTTVNAHWNHGQAYLAEETPAQWRVDANPRFPDVILMPEVGFAVFSTAEKSNRISAGDHGWAPEAEDMHGFFVAAGPNIRPGVSLGPVNMVDIHPLMLAILGLEGPADIDGDIGKLAGILQTTAKRD